MPGPTVHVRLTIEWAIQEGLDPAEADAVGLADITVDRLWPGGRHPARHFNPMASAIMAPLEMRRAVSAAKRGDRAAALTHLGRSLHSRQDAVGHGRVIGLNHIAYNAKVLRRNPDDWASMPDSVRARIERASRRAVREFLAKTR